MADEVAAPKAKGKRGKSVRAVLEERLRALDAEKRIVDELLKSLPQRKRKS